MGFQDYFSVNFFLNRQYNDKFNSAPPMIFAEIYQSVKTAVDRSPGNLGIFVRICTPAGTEREELIQILTTVFVSGDSVLSHKKSN